jgi:hypothetical protein
MARKHRRRTRNRKKKGGSMDKWKEGLQGWKDIGSAGKEKAKETVAGVQDAAYNVKAGYDRSATGGDMLAPIHDPPSSHQPPLSAQPPQLQHYENPMNPKEKKGGLLGLGWLGLGGRRLSHSSFINKMLRVRSKSKRNKSIRKYLTGGKKKTKKRRVSKKRRTKRRRR